MTHFTYLRFEILRTLRNRRFLIFSLAFPLVLFVLIAGPNRHVLVDGVKLPLYYMASLAAWGSMNAVISSGSRIAQERSIGWTRQLRITPLTTTDYFSAKILSGYMMALFSIIVFALVGSFFGVRLPALGWLTFVGLLLVGLIPFSILGVLLGHLIKIDSLGPAIGGATALFALLGGAFGPIGQSGVLFHVIKVLPSYWLVQAGKSALGGPGWTLESWLVIVVWSVVLAGLSVRTYQRDTSRV